MKANTLSGTTMSEELLIKQIREVDELKALGVTPGLAVILVGEDAASKIYVRNKERACEKIGIISRTIRLPADITEQELIAAIEELNVDESIHGILVQLPLPLGLCENEVLSHVLPEKDVDGFHVVNAGKLFTGQKGTVPCTPKGILYMLKSTGISLCGKEAVIVGRSNIVGKPIAMLLLNENCTVTICHSKTNDLATVTKRADILVAAVGRAGFITAEMVKPGAVVIDVGINRVNGKVVGDVDYEEVGEIASYITPVPGGVGKMTISMLMQNTLEAAWKKVR